MLECNYMNKVNVDMLLSSVFIGLFEFGVILVTNSMSTDRHFKTVINNAPAIHCLILETYIAPLQDTTTQRRSQPSESWPKKNNLREM